MSQSDPILGKLPPSPTVINSRFEQSAICLAAFSAEELIGYLWLALDGFEEDEVRVRFQPMPADATAFDFDVYIFPEYRGGLAFAALWDATNKFLASRGIQFTCSRVSRYNSRSIESHNRLGATTIGHAVFFCGSKRQFMISTLRPFLHLSLSPKSRPTLCFEAHPKR
jgi:hypothetical protein